MGFALSTQPVAIVSRLLCSCVRRILVSPSDFRQVAARAETGKAERLFRAAISAFCSLTRPSRRETAQLEDLVLPLFDQVSAEARRQAAAALSENPYAPTTLVRRLADEIPSTAAPLLVRSPVLGDVDLIALIGRHGAGHARIIGRRDHLNPTIAALVRALEQQESTIVAEASPGGPRPHTIDPRTSPIHLAAEAARHQLREMMRPVGANTPGEQPMPTAQSIPRLVVMALTGRSAFFQAALAEELKIPLDRARRITDAATGGDLISALRALRLSEEQAFLVCAALDPTAFNRTEAIRLFLDRYRLCHPDVARERVEAWKSTGAASNIPEVSDNEPGGSAGEARLRAS